MKTARATIAAIIIFVLAFSMAGNVMAQGQDPYIIDSTKPISSELKDSLNAWLAVDSPSSAKYYIVTNVDAKSDHWIVSLVGVDLENPDSPWSLEENNQTVWMGSVVVYADGSVQPFTFGTRSMQPTRMFARPSSVPGGDLYADYQSTWSQITRSGLHVASGSGKALYAPSRAAGGGSYVAFPFQAGTAMLYGVRGVHGSGDYQTTGMLAVDLLSGDDLGPDAAPPQVYASDAGVIDYVCDDGTSVAVRTYNASSGDYFLYAHLLDNDNLAISTNFEQGELIGNLKYGSFNPADPDCGWAEQQPDHYHVHWMFVPSNNAFRAEGCVLSVSTQKWTCNTKTIGTGGWITGGGGYGAGADDPFSGVSGSAGGSVSEKTFWDYLLIAIVTIFDRGLLKLLPEHTSPLLLITIVFNAVKLILETAWVLIRFNINLGPTIAIILYAITSRIVMNGIFLVIAIYKAAKSSLFTT